MATQQYFLIFGKPECVYCVRAKRALDAQGWPYDFLDIRDENNRNEMNAYLRETGVAAPPARIPQVFRLVSQRRGGERAEYIGGFDRLSALLLRSSGNPGLR
jgi:glutaredoxin